MPPIVIAKFNIWVFVVAFLFLSGLGGCTVHGPMVSGTVDMTPTVKPNSSSPIGKTLRVGEVFGPNNKPVPKVSADALRSAIVRAFASSRIFLSVSADPPGDLELRTFIVAGDITKQREFSSFEMRVETTVRYEIVDTTTGDVVWRDTFRGAGGSTTFNGGTAFAEAREIGLRETIAALVEGVGMHWDKTPK